MPLQIVGALSLTEGSLPMVQVDPGLTANRDI